MQRVLLATVLDPKTKPAEKAICANSYAGLEQMKRNIRGVGNPKAVDMTRLNGKRAKVIEFTSPTEPIQEQAIEASPCNNGQEPPEAKHPGIP